MEVYGLGVASGLTLSALLLTSCSASQSTSSPSPVASPSASASKPAPVHDGVFIGPPLPAQVPPGVCGPQSMVMSLRQKALQVLMVAAEPGKPLGADVDAMVRQGVGGVILHPGNDVGKAQVTANLAAMNASTMVRPLVTVDQEGGNVLRLRGEGFTPIPAASSQGMMDMAELRKQAVVWGKDLKTAGVNVDLAPVADVVPVAHAGSNEPVSRVGRGYGSDPEEVSARVKAVGEGFNEAGVGFTLKHYPGLGASSKNTDFGAATDGETTLDSPLLKPFHDNAAAADMVMMSWTIYTKIDAKNEAGYSPVVHRKLRETGFKGVTVSDDVGSAEAVANRTPGARAVDFLSAGGDLVTTVDNSVAPAMASAIEARAGKDSVFSQKLSNSVARILELKVKRGIHRC